MLPSCYSCNVLFFIGGRHSSLVKLLAPLDRNRTFFHLKIATRVYLERNGAIIIYFINTAVDTGDGNNFIPFLKIVLELLGILCFLGLWTDHEEVENQYHSTQ